MIDMPRRLGLREFIPAGSGGEPLEESTMEGNEDRAVVGFVELVEPPACDERPWFFPAGEHRVTQVVGRFDDVAEARAVAVGLNRQVRRARGRRWALIVEGADAEQIGVGSTVGALTILSGALAR